MKPHGGAARGYTDYPTLQPSPIAEAHDHA
jgi:hypothetical protein